MGRIVRREKRGEGYRKKIEGGRRDVKMEGRGRDNERVGL